MTAPLPDKIFFYNKRVLLTGHTGFKGAWAALWLARLGAKVTGFALPPNSDPSLFELARVDGDLTSILGDLRDRDAVKAAVKSADPQIVLHMAAQPIVRRAITDPIETIASNVLGTAHLLDALRDVANLNSVVVVTSDKVYANDDKTHAFTETDPLGGKDPYSASKAAAEMVTRAFADTYFAQRGVRVVTARGGNVIGGGDYAADRIVPDIIRAVAKGERPVIRMPHAIRPWQHVLDCICGYLLYAQALQLNATPPRTLNFGPAPGKPITVGALTEVILAALGHNAEFHYQPDVTSVEMKTLEIDASKAREVLGWTDRLPGESAPRWTAEWYNANYEGTDPRAATLAQLERYCALASSSQDPR
jgi:CDP-glucose 4,6-dehydratase